MVSCVQVNLSFANMVKDTFLAEGETSGSASEDRGSLGSHVPWDLQDTGHRTQAHPTSCIPGRKPASVHACLPSIQKQVVFWMLQHRQVLSSSGMGPSLIQHDHSLDQRLSLLILDVCLPSY